MKILQVIDSLGRGGAEQAVVNLLPTLQSRGHQCEVAALMPPYDVAENLELAGIVVHRLNLSHRWNLAQGISGLTTLCRRHEYDLVHAHLFFAALYTAMSQPLAPAPKRVVTFHGLEYDVYPVNTLWRKIRKAIHRWLMEHCIDGWVGVGNGVAQHYKAHFGLSSVVVIPNAFPLETFCGREKINRGAILSQYGVSPKDFTMVMPGRLVPQKGHRYFLQALVLLKEKGLRPQVLFFGDGPLEGQLHENIASKDLQEQVTIHPAIPHGELLPVLQAGDAVVMPSTQEGFGLVACEAMALERPLLATRVSGIVDIVEDGISGLLVPSADPDLLADGIARLMGDSALRERLGKAGRKRIESHFSVVAIAPKWHEYYQGLMIS